MPQDGVVTARRIYFSSNIRPDYEGETIHHVFFGKNLAATYLGVSDYAVRIIESELATHESEESKLRNIAQTILWREEPDRVYERKDVPNRWELVTAEQDWKGF